MSWWVNRTRQTGRRYVWLIDFPPLLIPILIALAIGLVLPLIRYPKLVAIGSVGIMLLGYAYRGIAQSHRQSPERR